MRNLKVLLCFVLFLAYSIAVFSDAGKNQAISDKPVVEKKQTVSKKSDTTKKPVTRQKLLNRLNRIKTKYMTDIDNLDVKNRLLRRECDVKKADHYNTTEQKKLDLRREYGYHFLDAHKERRLKYRAKVKALDMKNRNFVKSLDEKSPRLIVKPK